MTPIVNVVPLDTGYQVRLQIGVQHFDISIPHDDPADAWFLAKQLRAAMGDIAPALARDEKPYGWVHTAAGMNGAFSRNLPKSIREQTFNGQPQWTALYLHPPETSKDAVRYRWLEKNVYQGVSRLNQVLWCIRGLFGKDKQTFGEAIDAAMKEEQSHE